MTNNSYLSPHQITNRVHCHLEPFHVTDKTLEGSLLLPKLVNRNRDHAVNAVRPNTNKRNGMVSECRQSRAVPIPLVDSTPAVERYEAVQASSFKVFIVLPCSTQRQASLLVSLMPPRRVDLSAPLWPEMFETSFCRRTILASCEVGAGQ